MKSFILTGPESTGKTWLSGLLAGKFETSWRPEYLREFYDRYDGVSEQEIPTIAKTQIEQENELLAMDLPLVFFDTNIITLKIYHEHYFESQASWFDELYDQSLYSHYLLLDTSVPWEADPQRDSPEVREQLFHKFKTELEKLEVDFTVITGEYKQRIDQATNVINDFVGA